MRRRAYTKMKKTYSIYNLKLNSLFLPLIIAVCVLIVANIVYALAFTVNGMEEFFYDGNIVSNSALSVRTNSYNGTFAIFTVAIVLFLGIVQATDSDFKYFVSLQVGKRNNMYANLCISATLAFVVAIAVVLADLTDICVLRFIRAIHVEKLLSTYAFIQILSTFWIVFVVALCFNVVALIFKECFCRRPKISVAVVIVLVTILVVVLAVARISASDLFSIFVPSKATAIFLPTAVIAAIAYCLIVELCEVKR